MVKLEGTISMYNYCLPVLTAWAVRQGYEMPPMEEVARLRGYYDYDGLKEQSWLGSHCYNGEHTIIKVRPGEKEELGTWAHEFAHFIQRYNLGGQWRVSYNAANIEGYKSNTYEAEAREADDMALVFEAHGWLYWEVDYSVEGTSSVWPRPKPAKSNSWGMSAECYYEMRSYLLVDRWDTDWQQYELPAQRLLATLIRIILKIYSPSYTDTNITNMQQHAA